MRNKRVMYIMYKHIHRRLSPNKFIYNMFTSHNGAVIYQSNSISLMETVIYRL